MSRSAVLIVFLWMLLVVSSNGAVRVNELSAATSTRLLTFAPDSTATLGTTVPWHGLGFDASSWSSSQSPINWNATPGLEAAMRFITPSIYVRREFVVTASEAASGQDLDLDVNIDFGYVAYLNGVEVARRNLGPTKAFVAFDHLAYNKGEGGSQSRDLGSANNHLVEGMNVLAFQVHTWDLDESVSVAADLSISGGADLVTMTDSLDYFVGVTEPSGGVFDLLTPDPGGMIDHGDWIELYNDGTAVNLSGWGLSDNPQNPLKWVFPSGTTIPTNGFLVVMADGLDVEGNQLHTNFSLAGSGESVVLSNASGVVQHSVIDYPEQDYFHTYGWTPGGVWKHLDRGTPGATNVTAGLGDILPKPDLSVSGGFYDGAVSVELMTSVPGATIRYTTDGSEPTSTNGSDYSGGSLAFNEPVVLRARSVLAGSIPSEIVTETFLIYDPSGPLGFLRDNPALSISGDDSRTIYNENGIASEGGDGTPEGSYALRLLRGRFTERQANLEFLFPGNPAGSSVNSGAGIRFAGSTHSRNSADMSMLDLSPWPVEYNTRPSMNLFFRDDYGKKDIPGDDLIPASSVKTQATMRLRSGKNDTTVFTQDEIVRRAMGDMGHPSSIGNFVNVWVSGDYKGMFNLTERYRKDYFQEFFDTDDDFDVISSGADDADSGDMVAWNAMRDFYANNDLTVPANYEAFSTMLDIDNFIDFVLTISYSVNADWGNNNWAFVRQRSPDGKFMGLVWDAEATFQDYRFDPESYNMYDGQHLDVSETGGDNPSGEIFTALRDSPEFKLRFADRMAEHLFHDGALTEAKWVQRQSALRAQIEETWEFLKDRSYNDTVMNEWFSKRLTGLLVSGEQEGFWSQTDPSIMPLPPEFSQHGGSISNAFNLTVVNPNSGASSEVYYTLDEMDPRLVGGGLASSAQLYEGPIDLGGFTGVVSARALVNGVWGPIQDATFISATPPPLRIIELMYHPADPSAAEQALGFTDADDFEFIELRNVSGSSLDVSNYAFTAGVVFDFGTASSTTVGPGQRVLLVRNVAAFEARYGAGLPVIGAYTGGLKNSSEQIILSGPGAVAVHEFVYEDVWYPTTDGDGFSLEIIDDMAATSTWALAASWQPSGSIGGSPGTGSGGVLLPPAGAIVINEILTHSDGPEGDWIELYNTSSSTVDIGGWFLSDDPGTPLKYEIAAGTTLAGNGYVVFNTRDHFGSVSSDAGALVPFGLSEKGDEVVLSSGAGGSQTGYQEQESFEGADNGVTFGRHILSESTVVFTTLESPTSGSVNSVPLVGPVVISEINYNPEFGGYEYIKILNTGTTAVPMYDVAVPANTWQMTNGVEFTFPPEISLDPGAYLMLVSFDPDLSPSDLSTFVNTYDVAIGADVLGPYIGGLSNGGERVSLSKTGAPDPTPPHEVPLIVVDSVKYKDSAPWPTGPDGLGETLVRVDLAVIGDEPMNWQGEVTRAAISDNADLAGLTMSSGSLAPSFDSGTFAYTASVSHETSSLTVTPVVDDEMASVEVRVSGGSFTNVSSGSESPSFGLNVGANEVDVKVTAEDGGSQTYSVVVSRADSGGPNLGGDLPTLASLLLSAGSLSPEFEPNTLAYAASVDYPTASIMVTPTTADVGASIAVRLNGGSFSPLASGATSVALPLNVGDNTVDVRVTSEVGTAVYGVFVNRLSAPDPDLSALAVSLGTLSPAFESEVEDYEIAVVEGTASITVTPIVADPSSTIELRINGSSYEPTESGVESVPLSLDEATNVIDLRVTASDAVTQKVYTITSKEALRVTTLLDEDNGLDVGGVSLREAIEAPGDVIDFDPSLNGQTIVLESGNLSVEKSVLIDASALPNGITVSGNNASRVLRVRSGHSVSINRVSFVDGRLDGQNGAGISNAGLLHLVDLTVTDNVASGSRGGGIYNSGSMTLERVSILNNSSERGGGFSCSGSNPSVTMTNCTIAGNTSNRGGGISHRVGEMKLIGVTIAANLVPSDGDGGGGIYSTGDLTIENSIIAGNTSSEGKDIRRSGGTLTASGSNLIGSNDSVEDIFPIGPLVGSLSSLLDAKLAPVGDYGGLTHTMALAPGSPAKDAGLASGQTPAVDQRGGARVFGEGLDLGAYEESVDLSVSYSAWIAEQLPNGSDLAASSDYDGDGLSNLTEYGRMGDPSIHSDDEQSAELVTETGSGEDHLLITFPHRLDAQDLIIEVRAASGITELGDGGNHIVLYRFEDGTMTEGAGLVSRDDNVIPSVVEVMDQESTSGNVRRFIQLRTILK